MHASWNRFFIASAVAISLAAPLSRAQQPAQSVKPDLKVFDPSLVDTAVDPCQNFYQFSCNKWFARNPLPPDQTSYGRFTELAELNREHLHGILEAAASPSSSRTANEQKIGDEYASCMDVAAINARGIRPLDPELNRIAALRSKSELPSLLAHLQAIGVNAFFGMGSNADFDDANAVITFYSAGGLGLPERDFYTRTDDKTIEQRKQYVEHVTNILKLSGESTEQAAQDAAIVLAIETRLAKASLTITEEREPKNINHPTNVSAFSKTLTNFSLPEYTAALGGEPGKQSEPGKINVMQPKFYAEFNTLIADTPIEQIRAYLRWHLLHAFAGTSLPESFDHETWSFYSHTLNGAEKQQDRWKRCTTRIDREMGEALGQVYVARYFSADDKQRTLDMTIAIEKAMDKDLNQLDWMSQTTKEQARIKLHAVMNKIGYPDKWRDYSSLNIVRGEVLANQMRVNQFETKRDLAKIGKPVDRGEWGMTPPTVNAYYDPQQNNVNFPAGYLQPPFFSGKEDDAANYGDMGSTIGHELTHGFDDEGHQFDATGNLRNWWTPEDEKQFNEKSDCVVKQYDAIEVVPGVHMNGKLTLGENLADIGGLWLAWYAWLDKVQAAHLDMNAKTDGYTPDQRFWIAYAQQWCTQTRPEQLRTQAQTDPHAADEYRTNAVLADVPDFAKSFSCKKSSPMVKPDPCRVW